MLVAPHALDHVVGHRLEHLRKKGGISREQFALDTGFSASQIRQFEEGESGIDPSVLWQFCGVLDVTVGEFFAGLEAADAE